MDRIEREATIDSLTQLENYYQSRYEHYLAMATEAKENKERVGLLLLDLDRDVSYPDNLVESKRTSHGSQRPSQACRVSRQDADLRSYDPVSSSINRQQKLEADSHQSLDNQRVNLELPQAKPEIESPPLAVVDEENLASSTVEQMRRWTLDLFKAMSVIESVSNSDSGKVLHQNYLHHLLNRELDIELSSELVELYLEEAVIRGYLEPDEFNNDCYRGKAKDDSGSEAFLEQNENIAIDPAIAERSSERKSYKPYDLPDSNKLKPTLFETIEGYIEENRPKRFSIEDVVNYLYPQSIQLDWDKVQRNKVRISISNVLSRKAYLSKHWSRIKPGVYRPRV